MDRSEDTQSQFPKNKNHKTFNRKTMTDSTTTTTTRLTVTTDDEKAADQALFASRRGSNCFHGYKGQRAAISFTGGKDCSLALQRTLAAGLEVVCCAIFFPPGQATKFQAHRIEWQQILANAMGLPIAWCCLSALKVHATDYQGAYAAAIRNMKLEYDIHVIVTGDIDYVGTSTNNFMQQVTQERDCSSVQVLLPLWNQPRKVLLEEMLFVHKFDIRFCCVKSPYFDETWIGRRLDQATMRLLEEMANEKNTPVESDQRPLDLTGENGEYHTMVVNGPMFRTPLRFTNVVPNELLNQRGQKANERWWVMDEKSFLGPVLETDPKE